ncbi:MAG: hypothetical protein LBO63_01775 [Oscillospiraceae bacterium]|jgi:hypothetical protein|nr:hypothetical protein [Oscillospiraceae bacterium]
MPQSAQQQQYKPPTAKPASSGARPAAPGARPAAQAKKTPEAPIKIEKAKPTVKLRIARFACFVLALIIAAGGVFKNVRVSARTIDNAFTSTITTGDYYYGVSVAEHIDNISQYTGDVMKVAAGYEFFDLSGISRVRASLTTGNALSVGAKMKLYAELGREFRIFQDSFVKNKDRMTEADVASVTASFARINGANSAIAVSGFDAVVFAANKKLSSFPASLFSSSLETVPPVSDVVAAWGHLSAE